jgi:hypothetical protein
MYDIEVDQQTDLFPAQLEECDQAPGGRVNRFDFDHHGIFHENLDPESEIDPLAFVVHSKG